ncbi:MAG: hypothetical protein ACYTHJ_16620 [Planctomycetota bacterium]|jgi:hypothetical protein
MTRSFVRTHSRRIAFALATGPLLFGVQCPIGALLPLAPEGDSPMPMGACLPDEPDCDDMIVIDEPITLDGP